MSKPSPRDAQATSTAAACMLFVFVLSAGSDTQPLLLPVVGVISLLLTVLAVSRWRKYFEALIEFRIAESAGPGEAKG